ncbi:MAG: hypothetical protein V5786_05105 [Psychromonas sp.]
MLTKLKVVQLFFILVILLGLFFWKTVDKQQGKELTEKPHEMAKMSLLTCDYQQACEFITEQGKFLLSIKNLPIKAEQWIDFELVTPQKNIQISNAQIVGKSMFMGIIPVTFKPSSALQFISKAIVGSCAHAQMVWTLEIMVDDGTVDQKITFDFMVKH